MDFLGCSLTSFLGYKATNKSQNAPSFLDLMKSYAFQSAEITRLWAWLYYSPAIKSEKTAPLFHRVAQDVFLGFFASQISCFWVARWEKNTKV